MVAEKKENNNIRLIRGYDLVASDIENARTYYHYASNELGSITHIVDAREVLNRYEYDVWGNLAVCEEKVPNRFLFTGQQYDPITQQYYLRARFYNPAIARFTQEDTYRRDGLNLYFYCCNNPVRYVDPSGHWCEKKERVYQKLLKREGLTAEQAAADPDLQLRLMAEVSNIVRGKVTTTDGTLALPGSTIGDQLALPGPGETSASSRRAIAVQKLADAATGINNRTVNPLTGIEVGRFVADDRGNTMI